MNHIRFFMCMVACLAGLSANAAPVADLSLKGINLAGAEFAADKLPGTYGTDYTYPSPSIIAAYARFGMNVIRLPFLWERIQPRLEGPLNAGELNRLDSVVIAADRFGVTVILDMHNYGAYRGKTIGDAAVPATALPRVWTLLAEHYAKQGNVAFGVMNEPVKQDAAGWAKIAKATLLAIRAAGARQLVLVPGTIWTGAHSWNDKVGKLSNAQALAALRDPADNMAIEFHHYFDYNYSGTHDACTAPAITEQALQRASIWLRKTKHKGFLAEFGASKDATCTPALAAALDHLEKHKNLWLGWTYWAASEWFGDYPFNVYPVKPDTYPQLNVLAHYLKQ